MGIFRTYRDLGFSCVPAKLGAKRPPVEWKKYQTAFPTEEEISRWDQEAEVQLGGAAQIGIITGALSNIVVLDVDGPEGHKWLRDTKAHLPLTVSAVSSPGDGIDPDTRKVHYYYRHPGPTTTSVPTKVKFRPGLDSRGDGGFIMAPPSLHKAGHRYAWSQGLDPTKEGCPDIAPMPAWFLKALGTRVMISDTDQLPPDKSLNLDGVPKGERNAAAARLTGRWFAMGLDESEVLLLVSAWNTKNDPPLKEKEIEEVVKSISQREARSRAAKVGAGKIDAPKDKKYVIPWHEERASMLAGLSKRLDIEIIDIQKITGDEPTWKFTFGEGKIAAMKTPAVFVNQQFRQKIFEQIGRVLIPITNKKGDWDKICQVISDAAELIDGSIEATKLGEIRVALEDYFANFKPEIWDESDRPPLSYPFLYGDKGFIFSSHLLHYLNNNKNMKIPLRDLAQGLTVLGFKNIRERVAGFQIRVWEMPVEFMPPAGAQPAGGKDNVVAIKRF